MAMKKKTRAQIASALKMIEAGAAEGTDGLFGRFAPYVGILVGMIRGYMAAKVPPALAAKATRAMRAAGPR
jgi:hypothetical protein